MCEALAEFKVAQAEEATKQQAFPDSIQSELEVTANRSYLRQAETDLDEALADMDFGEDPE